MSNFRQGAESIKRLAVQLQGIVELATELEAIGSIDQAKNEALAVTAQANKERDAALTRLKKVNAEIETVEKNTVKVIVDATNTAESIQAAAKAEANSLLDDARKKSSAIVSSADANAQLALASVYSKIEDGQKKLKELTETLADLEKSTAAAQANADSAEARLAKVQEQIAILRTFN